MSDYISRNRALKYVADMQLAVSDETKPTPTSRTVLEWLWEGFKDMPSADVVEREKWIEIKWHNITDEEREENGYPKEWLTYLDCEMPCDNQEILVQTKDGHISLDVCYEDGEYSLDSGWDWIDDIVAWMPLPKPFERSNDK